MPPNKDLVILVFKKVYRYRTTRITNEYHRKFKEDISGFNHGCIIIETYRRPAHAINYRRFDLLLFAGVLYQIYNFILYKPVAVLPLNY